MSVVFLDIDTQIDFIMPHGALYVKDAERLLPVYEQLSRLALKQAIPVLASADAHHAGDPEFKQFPPHCLKGSAGQQKVPQTRPDLFYVQENDGTPVDDARLKYDHVLFEKQTFDVFSNAKIESYLHYLQPSTVVVYGVATDYCVKAAVEGLLIRRHTVWLLIDAIKAVQPAREAQLLEEFRKRGVRLITFKQLPAEL